MQAVRTIQTPVNGQLLIQVPEQFHDLDLEIIILPVSNSKPIKPRREKKDRLKMVAHLKGILPNLPYSKYDVYEQ